MTEQELILEAEAVGMEIEPVQHGNVFHTDDPLEVIARATRIAAPLADLVRKQKLTSSISGKEHVRVEGWTLLGSMLGVYPVCEWTRKLEDGWEARVEARTLSGQVVGAAEAQCTRSENMWKSRDEYALRSMAQTRATSKALRQPLGFVMQLAGFDPTPAEEMPRSSEPVNEQRVEGPKPLAAPKSWAKLTEMVSAYDQQVHDWFFAFADSLRRLEFPDSTDTKSLGKQDRDWLFQKCAGAAVHLRETYEPSQAPFPTIDSVRVAYASVLDGLELTIPDEELDAEAAEAAARES